MLLNRLFRAFAVAGSVLLAGQAIAGVGGQPAPTNLQDSIDRTIERRMQEARIVGKRSIKYMVVFDPDLFDDSDSSLSGVKNVAGSEFMGSTPCSNRC